MQEDDYLVPLFQICMVSTCVPLIILLTDHQDKLALQQMEKFNRFKWGEEMSQFKVGYINFAGIKQQNTLQEQVQKSTSRGFTVDNFRDIVQIWPFSDKLMWIGK